MTIRLQLISGECKVTSNLSRMLGQYQINTSKFCTKFNAESNLKFQSGILFNIQLQKISKDVFSIIFCSPSLKFLISQFLKNYNTLKLHHLYDIYNIYNFLNLNIKINLKNYFGTLSTFNLKFF